jgi:ParB-like chromosome segregation protein Spo0J
MTEMTFHRFAAIFPMMRPAEFEALVADVLEHGVREPIILYDGQILDGRNRFIAAGEAGVDVRYETYSGEDPIAYVVSRNLHRRHLDESQRAMVAAKIAELTHGGNQGPSGKFAARSDVRRVADPHRACS